MKKVFDRRQIIGLLNNYTSVKDVAKIADCSIPFVYKVAEEIGYEFVPKRKLDDLTDDILRSVDDGLSYAELARKYGVSKHTIINFCRAKGIQNQTVYERFAESVPQKVKRSCPNIEYVGGYTNTKGTIDCVCLVCGNTITIPWQAIKKHYARCPVCNAEEKERMEQCKRQNLLQKQEARKKAKEQREQEKQLQKEQERLLQKEDKRLNRLHSCPVCGEITDRPKFCSRECMNKAHNKNKEIKRRNILKNQMVDKDITLQSLFKRDGGVCYLCGKPCRMEDYVTRGETIVAGDWYPSIDHIIPLAKGGEHSWSNVRLAHRLCNSLKSDRVYP